MWGEVLAVALIVTGIAGAFAARRGYARPALGLVALEFVAGTYLSFKYPTAPEGADGDMMLWGINLMLFAFAVASVWAGSPKTHAIF